MSSRPGTRSARVRIENVSARRIVLARSHARRAEAPAARRRKRAALRPHAPAERRGRRANRCTGTIPRAQHAATAAAVRRRWRLPRSTSSSPPPPPLTFLLRPVVAHEVRDPRWREPVLPRGLRLAPAPDEHQLEDLRVSPRVPRPARRAGLRAGHVARDPVDHRLAAAGLPDDVLDAHTLPKELPDAAALGVGDVLGSARSAHVDRLHGECRCASLARLLHARTRTAMHYPHRRRPDQPLDRDPLACVHIERVADVPQIDEQPHAAGHAQHRDRLRAMQAPGQVHRRRAHAVAAGHGVSFRASRKNRERRRARSHAPLPQRPSKWPDAQLEFVSRVTRSATSRCPTQRPAHACTPRRTLVRTRRP